MKAWIIYAKNDAEYNRAYIECYFKEGSLLDLEVNLIYLEELTIGVKDGRWFVNYKGKEIARPDFAICRTIYPLLSKQLEYMGIPVFNNSMVAEICNDKARTYQYIAQLKIPIVDTEFCKKELLLRRLSMIDKPCVVKSVAGHGGKEVFLIEKEEEVSTIHEQIKNSDAVIQPLVGQRHQDLRVYVIGKQIIACVLRTAKEGFKSNYSLGGEVGLYELKESEKAVVEKIINMFDFGLVGIDFIIGDDGSLLFNEIEDVVGARMLYQCSEVNIVREYLNYILKKLKE